MKIRFLALVDSSVPGFPFQVGQIIETPHFERWHRRWVGAGLAEIVPEDEAQAVVPEPVTSTPAVVEEVAVAPAVAETAVVRRGKRGRKHHD